MYNWRPKNAEVDPDNPSAWGACARCGMVWNLDKLSWQFAYAGAMTPQNTQQLVCPKHLDPLNPQDAPLILPPDPLPVFNARPFPYVLEEASWLATEDGDTLETESGDDLSTPIPNPSDDASVTDLTTEIET